MSNPTVPPTPDMKSGLSATDSKTRIKRKEGKIKEVEASVSHDGKITYEEDGEEKDFVVEDYHSYNVALGMCQTEGVEGMEVSEKFFNILAKGKATPFIITGMPAVKVFPLGTMEHRLKVLKLSVRRYEELLAKAAREKAAVKQAEEDSITHL